MDVALIAHVYTRRLRQLPRGQTHTPDKNRHLRALLDQPWLIPVTRRRIILRNNALHSIRRPSIATRKHIDRPSPLRERARQRYYKRRLPRASHREIAHTHDWPVKPLRTPPPA